MGALEIAEGLETATFSSQHVATVDSAIVLGIFGQQTRKKLLRSHDIQAIAVDFELKAEERQTIWQLFESGKEKFDLDLPYLEYKSIATSLGSKIYRSSAPLQLGPEARPLIVW
jgi:hypothetical protein